MNLLTRSILAAGALFGCVLFSVHVLSHEFVQKRFLEIEEIQLAGKVDRVVGAVQYTHEQIERVAEDWSSWDDLYSYMGDRNPYFKSNNLSSDTLDTLGLDLLLLTDAAGEFASVSMRLDGQAIPDAEANRLVRAAGLANLRPANSGEDDQGPSSTGEPHGQLVRIGAQIMLVSTQAIARSDGTGDFRGTITLGRCLQAQALQRLTAMSGASVSLVDQPSFDRPLPNSWSEAVFRRINRDEIAAQTPLTDVHGQRVAWLQVNTARTIAKIGTRSTGIMEIVLAAAGLALLVLFGLVQHMSVVRPVRRLSTEVNQIAGSADSKARLAMDPGACTEISVLTRRINEMMDGMQKQEQLLADWALQLDASRTTAVAASRAKSEFLANMSHEIRTPMTAILGFSDLLFEDGRPASALVQQEAVRTIQHNAQHLLGLINEILDLSKIEAGRMTVESVPTSILETVESVRELMALKATSAGVVITREIHGEIPVWIDTDPVRLRQILVNLVSNAIKFTPSASDAPGRITLSVQGALVAEPQGSTHEPRMIEIVCRDTGIGISDDLLPRLFNPFTQADASTTRKYGGTGLGLAICHRLARMLGGELSVVRHTGAEHGTSFVLRLPLVAAAGLEWHKDPAQFVQASRSAAAGAGNKSAARGIGLGGGLGGDTAMLSAEVPAAVPVSLRGRILVAEDGVDNQRLIRHMLTKAGAEVVVVENGRAAIDALKLDSSIGLVLMDMQMPEIDGYQATLLLREAGCKLPILALTAHAMASDRDRCLDAGCDDYLSKPIDRSKLIATVHEWLVRSRSDAAPRRAIAVVPSEPE